MTIAVTGTDEGSIEWVGAHTAITFSRVLKRIAQEQRSGDLQVALGRITKTIHLKQGLVVFAASNFTQDRLGEAMLERGIISEREFLLAGNLMRTEGRRFGEALVRMGLLTAEQLADQLCFQFTRIIRSLFGVQGGIYSFEERVPSIPDELMVQMSVPHLLLEGLRSVSDKTITLSFLPLPDERLRASTRSFSAFDICALHPEEMSVLRAARDGASLKSIVEHTGRDYHRVFRTCATLYLMGLIEPANRSSRGFDVRRRVRETYRRTEDMSPLDMLGLPSEPKPEETEKAYVLKRLEWTHIHREVTRDRELEPMVSEILFRLAAAYHNVASETAQPRAKAPSGSAHSLLAAVATSHCKTRSHKGGESGPARPKKRRRSKAELLKELKRCIQTQDWRAAIPHLFELVEMEPANATYRGLLGKAMFKHPVMRKNAERHFLEALRLAPKRAELHTWLGLYYKTFGMGRRATAAFRTALALDPDNTLARKYLASGANRRGHLKDPFRRLTLTH